MRIFDAAAGIGRLLLLALLLPAAAARLPLGAHSAGHSGDYSVAHSADHSARRHGAAGRRPPEPVDLLSQRARESSRLPRLPAEGRAGTAGKVQTRWCARELLVLFNPVTNSGTWDALIILKFARYADTRRWMDIERTAPGGLSAAGLRLAKPVDSYFADLRWQGATDEAATEGDSIYYVIPYEYSNAGDYTKYVDAYVVPQVKGWMREGVLSSYRLFMNRFGTGRPWDSLFIYQYRDLEAFGRRDEIVSKVRATLVGDPVWKHYSDIKQTLRTESENTIAEDLAAGHAVEP